MRDAAAVRDGEGDWSGRHRRVRQPDRPFVLVTNGTPTYGRLAPVADWTSGAHGAASIQQGSWIPRTPGRDWF
jgi:hypothetical protein